jgi:hypothetical protein
MEEAHRGIGQEIPRSSLAPVKISREKREAHKMARTTARNIRSIHPVNRTMALQDQPLAAMTRHDTHPPLPLATVKMKKPCHFREARQDGTVPVIREVFRVRGLVRSINSRW